MKYCSNCGQLVRLAIPPNDDRPRHICDACGSIHYQNPKLVTGCIPVWEGKILLCKRAIEPRLGYWTLPAGFMELGETLAQAAERETWEEAQAKVNMGKLYSVFSLSHISQVHVFFLAEMRDAHYAPGPESMDVDLFILENIPWKEMSFPTVSQSLRYFVDDLQRGKFPLHMQEIHERSW